MIANLPLLSSIWTLVCTTHLEVMLLPWLLPSYVAFILLLVKKSIVWRWKAKYIYNRFRGRLLIVGFQLYFLSRVNYRSKSKYNRGLAGSAIPISGRNEETPIRQLLKSPYHRDYLAEICPIVSFLTWVPLSNLDFHNEIQCILQPNSQGNNIASVEYVTEEALQQRLGVEYSAADAQLLLQQLQADLGTTNITYEAFRKGLVAANEDCLSLRHTLDNAFKVEAILNRVLTGILLLVISIFWVCLQTPFGGFMIRGVLNLKTAVVGPAIVISLITYLNKEWIDGLFFLFVVHPFHIGDRCLIEDKEVEIIEMNVLKTRCKNIDTEEEMTYKNSDLRDRIICKVLEQELKPADKIELVLDASNTRDIKSLLKEPIEGLFGKYTHVFQIKDLRFDDVGGNKRKMSVHFDHSKNYHEYMNPTKSFQGKKTRHSELDKEIRKILDEQNIKVAEQYYPVLLSSIDRLNSVV